MKNNLNNVFPSHFREFIEALNRNNVEYLLIGGYAVGAYGHIRGTGDLDIFINATEENANRILSACIDFGIAKEDLKKEMFIVPKMIGIGEIPLRIEILKKLDTIDFRYAYQRVRKVVIDNLHINVISLEDLILLKKAAIKGRSKARDTEDLTFLQKLRAKLST
ncbi:MAG TPA: nucleotidyltransferase [Cytophagales bacterium]|nr:nucleotidyltransferase [Cytophagales bacterium]